jgi:D-glycero-D-manno-heptose 1,7-bisphosphate phosphatase
MKNRAVFLDRDGTINKEAGYPADYGRISIYPASFNAVRLLNRAGLLAIVITNQSGVGRGLFSEDAVAEIHNHMKDAFAARNARLDAIYYCPHYEDAEIPDYRKRCDCRKPAAGLARRAASDFCINLSLSYTVGDKVEDVVFGMNIGATPVLVLTGLGRESLGRLRDQHIEPAFVAADILAAAEWILSRDKNLR